MTICSTILDNKDVTTIILVLCIVIAVVAYYISFLRKRA